MEINIARDFDPYPWGRAQGKSFRETILAPKLRSILTTSSQKLEVSLDGCRMLGSSFLDEAFAGLIRKGVVDRRTFERVVSVTASSPAMAIYLEAINRYVKQARLEK